MALDLSNNESFMVLENNGIKKRMVVIKKMLDYCANSGTFLYDLKFSKRVKERWLQVMNTLLIF